MKKVLITVLVVFTAAQVYAGGFRVALQSAKQLGMAHVGAGMQVGADNVFFNPGALSLAEKGNISISGNAVFAGSQYNAPGSSYTAELEDNIGTPFAGYGSFKINDRFAGGLGVYTPYGNRVEWPDNWAGRGISQSIDLKAIFIQPTLSYAITDKIGLGAGFIYALGEVELERGVPQITSTPEIDIMLETDGYATGYGFNAGLFIELDEDASLGINYRSKVQVEAEQGLVSFENVPVAAQGAFQATRFDASLPLPAELAFGAGWSPTEQLTFGADLNYIFWSQYESLQFDYDKPLGGSTSTVLTQDWQDSFTAKLGAQYDANDQLALRIGGYYDFSPIPDETLSPITPDSNRLSGTAGFSIKPSDAFSVDGSILLIHGEERTVLASDNQFGFGQRYKLNVLVPSLGFNYSF